MSRAETLTWSGSYPSLPRGRRFPAGLLLNPLTWPAYLALLALYFFPLPMWWVLPLLIPHVVIVFGMVMAAVATTVAIRNIVLSAEFTSQRVVLTRRHRSREVDVAELTTVAVEHGGSVGGSYTHTRLRLEWSRRVTVAISIPGPHDPTLAASLTQLLGRPVPESWHQQ
jgi:hypothetical protein